MRYRVNKDIIYIWDIGNKRDGWYILYDEGFNIKKFKEEVNKEWVKFYEGSRKGFSCWFILKRNADFNIWSLVGVCVDDWEIMRVFSLKDIDYSVLRGEYNLKLQLNMMEKIYGPVYKLCYKKSCFKKGNEKMVYISNLVII